MNVVGLDMQRQLNNGRFPAPIVIIPCHRGWAQHACPIARGAILLHGGSREDPAPNAHADIDHQERPVIDVFKHRDLQESDRLSKRKLQSLDTRTDPIHNDTLR
jgi:hypothetical protein